MDNMLIGSTLLALGKDEGSRSIAKISLFISSCEGIWIQGYCWMLPPFTVISTSTSIEDDGRAIANPLSATQAKVESFISTMSIEGTKIRGAGV